MATTPGQRFVRRHNAARGSTANGTAADIAYDTAVLSEGGYSWSSPEVTVDEAGLYLAIFDLGQVDLASTRSVGTLVPSVNGVDQTRFRATHRYLRNSGGSQQGASIGVAILNLAANDAVKVRNPGALTPTDAVGNYATNASFGGGLQLIRLNAGDFTHLERTVDAAEVGTSNINATRPWVDSSGTWTKITYNSEVSDDAGLFSGSGGDIRLGLNKKYLIVWGATIYSTDASRHTNIAALNIGGSRLQTGSGYHRNTASQGTPMCGLYLHETGGVEETAFLEATHEIEGGDAGTPQVSDAYFQLLELPNSAEWVHVDNGATDSLTTALAATGSWYDTPLSATQRSTSALSLDAANDAVQNDSGASLSVLAIGWHRWDRDSGASGTRKNPWTRWNNGGSTVGYGVAGAYSRGQQSSDDTFQAHYCSAVALDLADGADLSFQVNDEASSANSDMGIYANTNRNFLGVQVLDLSTLDDTGGGATSGDLNASYNPSLTAAVSADAPTTGALSVSYSASLTATISGTVETEEAAGDLSATYNPGLTTSFSLGAPSTGSLSAPYDPGLTASILGVASATADLAVSYDPGLVFTGSGSVGLGGSLNATFDPGLTALVNVQAPASGAVSVAYDPGLSFSGSGSVGLGGALSTTYDPGLTAAFSSAASSVGDMTADYDPTLSAAVDGSVEEAVFGSVVALFTSSLGVAIGGVVVEGEATAQLNAIYGGGTGGLVFGGIPIGGMAVGETVIYS